MGNIVYTNGYNLNSGCNWFSSMRAPKRSTNRMKKALLCGLASFAFTVQGPAWAKMSLQFNENDIMQRSDWVIFVRSTTLPNYLSYPGSQLCPMTQVRITYWKDLGASTSGTNRYEDLWYHSGLPVGCRRYNLLKMTPHNLGTIFVQPSADAQTATRALANAIIRLSVDLNLQQLDPTAVIVPEQIYLQLAGEFGHFGFHQRSVQSGPQTSIHLVSNPTVYDQYLYYDR